MDDWVRRLNTESHDGRCAARDMHSAATGGVCDILNWRCGAEGGCPAHRVTPKLEAVRGDATHCGCCRFMWVT
jgi:hypothetical protein